MDGTFQQVTWKQEGTYPKNQKATVEITWYIMRKQSLENVTLTGQAEDKNDRSKQRVTYLITLCKWMSEQGVSTSNEINIAKKYK